MGLGKNLRAREYKRDIITGSNCLTAVSDIDFDAKRQHIRSRRLHHGKLKPHHLTWGIPVERLLQRFECAPDERSNQIRLTLKYISLPEAVSCDPNGSLVLAWLLDLPPIAKVKFFETTVARAIVNFKNGMFGHRKLMLSFVWYLMSLAIFLIMFQDAVLTVRTRAVRSSIKSSLEAASSQGTESQEMKHQMSDADASADNGLVWAILIASITLLGDYVITELTTWAKECRRSGARAAVVDYFSFFNLLDWVCIILTGLIQGLFIHYITWFNDQSHADDHEHVLENMTVQLTAYASFFNIMRVLG